MQIHFNPYHSSATLQRLHFCKLQKWRSGVTVSVAEAVLCFSARVCKQQREVCNGQPKKKPNTVVIGPARSLGTGIADVTNNCYIVESCNGCLSIHWYATLQHLEQCGVTTYQYSKVSFCNVCRGKQYIMYSRVEFGIVSWFFFYHACGHITTALSRQAV